MSHFIVSCTTKRGSVYQSPQLDEGERFIIRAGNSTVMLISNVAYGPKCNCHHMIIQCRLNNVVICQHEIQQISAECRGFCYNNLTVAAVCQVIIAVELVWCVDRNLNQHVCINYPSSLNPKSLFSLIKWTWNFTSSSPCDFFIVLDWCMTVFCKGLL